MCFKILSYCRLAFLNAFDFVKPVPLIENLSRPFSLIITCVLLSRITAIINGADGETPFDALSRYESLLRTGFSSLGQQSNPSAPLRETAAFVVPTERLELSQEYSYTLLKRARLPIPPRRQ